jgi:protein tyrosine phosphatase type 4A
MPISSALLQTAQLSFLITDCPANIPEYIQLLKQHNVLCVIRLSKPTYDPAPFTDCGIEFHELFFNDGSVPPANLLDTYRSLISQLKGTVVAIHCVSGIGRAPLLVCVALIDEGNSPTDAIELVRSKRRGAVNSAQVKWLLSLKRKRSSIFGRIADKIAGKS